MTCDLCKEDYSLNPQMAISILRGGEMFGYFCSRFCAIHALVSSVSKDWADGPSKTNWRGGVLGQS